MARWRQAVELAMNDGEVASLLTISRSTVDGARRPAPARQGTDDHAGSEGLAGVAGVRQGQGARLSARVVDDAAAGAPCARARVGGGARMSRQPGAGNGVHDPRPTGSQTA